MNKRRRATARSRVGESSAVYEAPESHRRRLLLDTHVWLWWTTDNRRLGPAARDAIAAAREVRISAASVWEVAIKSGLGKLEVPHPAILRERIRLDGFLSLAVETEHAFAVATLPKVHRDPFDRLLVAQAMVEGLTLVTADPILAKYGVSVLSARD